MKLMARAIYIALFGLLAFSAVGCNAFGNTTPTPLPTIVLDNRQGAPAVSLPQPGEGVTASGVVVAPRQAQLAAAMSGTAEVLVGVGAQVEAGQPLVMLAGSEKLAAAVAAANLEVLSAQQALDALYQDMDIQQAEALKLIADHQDAVRDAERYLRNLQTQSLPADIDAAYANMIIARDRLDKAREDYQPYENKPEDNVTRAGLLSRLAQAQKDYDALVRQYNNLLGTASEIDLSQAQADLAIAQARLAKSQRDYEQLQNGPDPEAVRLAEARGTTAQAQLAAAEAALEDVEIRAPFSGTVTKLLVHTGDWIVPGQPVLWLHDLQVLQVETTDLSERDVDLIDLNQPVTVLVRALDLEVPGRVSAIAPLADTLGGDVVYATTIDLETQPPGLRVGMSVDVVFGSAE